MSTRVPTAISTTPVLRVREPEAELLRVAQALFAPATVPSVLPILRQACPLPPRLGVSAMRALEDVLAKGLVRLLARASTIPQARRGLPEVGWKLSKPPTLRFSASSFELLHWMVTRPLATAGPQRLVLSSGTPLTFADQVLFALALDALDAARLGEVLRGEVARHAGPFLWLFAPSLGPASLVPPPASFAELASEEGADALRLLAGWLAPRHARLVHLELVDPDVERLERLSLARAAVLERVTSAVLATRRFHALTFLADVEVQLIPSEGYGFDPRALVRSLFPAGVSLGQRERIRRASVATHRAIAAVAALRDRLRSVGFVDDDYEDAQRVLHLLEPWDEGRFARAADVVRLAEAIEPPEAKGQEPT